MAQRDSLRHALDIPFHRFMADEPGTVRAIYAAAGLPLSAAQEDRLTRSLGDRRRGRHGRVRYDLAGDFGLDAMDLRRRFQFYFDRFPIQPE